MKNKGYFKVDEKTAQEESKRAKFSFHLFKNVYRGVKIPWGGYILGWIFAFAANVVAGMKATQTAKIVTGDITDMSTVITYAVITIAASCVLFLAIFGDFASIKVNTRVRNKLWNKLMHLPVKYYDEESPNRVISRVTIDTEHASQPFNVLTVAVALVGLAVGVLSSGGDLNKTMMLVLCVVFVVVLIAMFFAASVVALSYYQVANRLSIFTSFLSERLGNFKLIKASRSEKRELEKGYEIIDLRYKAGMMQVLGNALVTLGMQLSTVGLYAAAFLVGAILLAQGKITDGTEINAFYVYGTNMALVLLLFAQVPTVLAQTIGVTTQFSSIFDKKNEDTATGNPMPESIEDISLNGVSFSYDGSRQVLEDITCTIPKGKKTAIVGANGSGKSTLVKLVDRLYPEAGGSIMLGNENAGDIALSAWRGKFAIVAQNASLFSGSIRDNICYGIEREVSVEELSQIARLAGIEDLVASHDEGFDFDIGLSGSRLSGGEQQRLSIARAFMKNPEYIILDEATANLDAKTEKQVKAAIDTLMKGRTVIMIAHNYDAIREADHIIVLDNGKIAAEGTHEELMESSDFYRQLASVGFET